MESERAVERTETNLQIIKQRMSRIEEEQTSKKGGADNEPMADRGKATDQTDRTNEKDANRYQGENSEKRLKSSSSSSPESSSMPSISNSNNIIIINHNNIIINNNNNTKKITLNIGHHYHHNTINKNKLQ